jgi:pilus assembly protein CpaE
MMTAMTPNETTRIWRSQRREAALHLYLSCPDGEQAAFVGARVADLPVDLRISPVDAWIDVEQLHGAAAAVIEVDADAPASIARFQTLAGKTATPLIAAAYDPPLTLVRTLLRHGARDVLPLPLELGDLHAALDAINKAAAAVGASAPVRTSKLVSVIKSVGGAGATSLLTQVAVRFAEHEAAVGREVCLVDLDVQFGDAAFQLGLRPKLSVADLLDAAGRLDGALARSAAVQHPSGLNVIAAPPQMMPLEALPSDQLIDIVDRCESEFGTVLLDLPANWTNWSLSLLARSDLVLLVVDPSLPSLHRARRQLDLIAAQDLGELDVRVVLNRFERSLFKKLRRADIHDALGRDISFVVANDPLVMRAAIDQGIPVREVKRKSAVGQGLSALDTAIAQALKLDR